MKKYYAFTYSCSSKTTSGQPNKKTGYMNIAGIPVAFKTKEERDLYLEMGDKVKEPLTKRQLREKCLGMSVLDFNEMLENL